jgi:hypothetical protein
MLTVLLLTPLAARTEEFQFDIRGRGIWTDNVFNVPVEQEVGGVDLTDNDVPTSLQELDPESDYSFRITPTFGLVDRDGELTWAMRYEPSYETYVDQSELGGFDHAFRGSLAWRFAERWNFSIQENFVVDDNVIRFNEAADPTQQVDVGFRDQGVQISETNAALGYSLSPIDQLTLRASYRYLEYTDSNQDSRQTPSLALDWLHSFSSRTRAGLNLRWTRQEARRQAGGDETSFYNLSGVLEHQFSPTLSFVASAGPTYIDSKPLDPRSFDVRQFPLRIISAGPPVGDRFVSYDADLCSVGDLAGFARVFPLDCPLPVPVTALTGPEVNLLSGRAQVPGVDRTGEPVPRASVEDDLTYFASLSLVKDWEHARATLGYTRSNSDSARFGSSTVADTLYTLLTWQPADRWTLALAGVLSSQEQTATQTVPVAFRVENVAAPPGVTSVSELAAGTGLLLSNQDLDPSFLTQSVRLRATRRLGEHATAFVSFYWLAQQQEVSQPVDVTTKWENFVVSVGFSWAFEPYRF